MRLYRTARGIGLGVCLALAGGAVRGDESDSGFDAVPPVQWQEEPQAEAWSEAAVEALETHGSTLVEEVPEDIATWCPGYARAPEEARRAFWVGLLSAISKHESTWRPGAVGGGGQWFGLMQILPQTAKEFGCRARTGAALKDGAANLSCAIRIMAATVPRDGVIEGEDGDWGGVAADWGPMRDPEKRRDMIAWLERQPYCDPTSPRPLERPAGLENAEAEPESDD